MTLAEEWNVAKQQLKIGQIVEGRVLAHWPFGVFVELGQPFVGLVEIPFFREVGLPMSAQEYPDLGSPIRAVVIHFSESNHQIQLSVRPSELGKATRG